MSRTALIVVLAAAAVCAFLTAFALHTPSKDVSPGDERESTPRAVRRAARAERPVEAAGAKPTDGSQTDPGAADPSGAPCVLVVRRSDGSPCGGARVRIVRPRGDAGSDVTLVADPDGRVVLHGEETDGAESILVSGGAGGADADVAAALSWDDGASAAEIAVRLVPALRVAGRVVGSDGAALAGATCDLDVEAGPRGARITLRMREPSVEGGVFEFPLVPRPDADARVRLRVSAQGRATADVDPADVVSGRPVLVKLARLLLLRGRCVDAEGRPVGPAIVWIGEEGHPSRDDGSFEIRNVRADAVVSVRADGFRAVTIPPLAASGAIADVGDVVCARGLEIRGVFADADGAPIAWARVSVRRGNAGVPVMGTTDALGRFDLGGLSEGTYAVRVDPQNALGGAGAAQADDVRPGDAIRLVASCAQQVRFRLRRESDRSSIPAPDATVLVRDAATRRTVVADSIRAWGGAPGWSEVIVRLPRAGTFVAELDIRGFRTGPVAAFDVAADRETAIDVLFKATGK